jgi:hypothetical protein
MKPTPIDIADAIAKIEAGPDPVSGEYEFPDYLDPGSHWYCALYDPDGQRACDGFEDTAGGAMAMAWVGAHAPEAIVNQHVELGAVPYNVSEGWRFELTPPQEVTPPGLYKR